MFVLTHILYALRVTEPHVICLATFHLLSRTVGVELVEHEEHYLVAV